MAGLSLELVLTGVGLVIPIGAALYEFLLIGRKRLGYRVQMDTTATDAVPTQYAGALRQLRQGEDGHPLLAPSFVLLRIENSGATNIDTNDYAVPDGDKVGIRVRFPGRRVAGMVVTELSDEFVRHSLGQDSGLNTRGDTIELPRVPLNRGAHYKVLAALDRGAEAADGSTKVGVPEVIGGIKGGVKRGGIQETRSHTGVPRKAVYMISFLVLVILAQLVVSYRGAPPPLDCARGNLTLVGSTAFRDVLKEAAAMYSATCDDASIRTDTRGSGVGLRDLNAAGQKKSEKPEDTDKPLNMLAFSDGEKEGDYPKLVERPVAFSLFTLVIHKDAGVEDLTSQQIRDIHEGRITNWSEIGGADVPIRLVSRYSGSGTRNTFERRILDGARERADNSDDCREREPGVPGREIRCARGSTEEVLNTVETTPGAMGYSQVGTVDERVREGRLLAVRIDGKPAEPDDADFGTYPFWETEYAYTYGEPKADSLAASFLRYLTRQKGADIGRSHGHTPCSDLANPALCQPEPS